MEFITGLLSTEKTTFPRKPSFPFLFAVVVTALSLTYFSLPLMGQWLVREDPIRRADAIAVLTGHFPQRAIEAAQLYRDGYAPEIWLTHPSKQGGFKEYGERTWAGEVGRNFAVLRSFGVPAAAIRMLDTPVVNTADELNAIDLGLRASGDSSVIVVTNKAHTRRVSSLWDKYHEGNGEVLVHAVTNDGFNPSRWWRTASSRAQVVHEFFGMINVWAGLPVHGPRETSPAASAGAESRTIPSGD